MDGITKFLQDPIIDMVLDEVDIGIVLSDPNQNDNPIIYVNKWFEKTTGYKKEDIIGKNCRFLQGEDTDQNQIMMLKSGLKEKTRVEITLKNYRKDGSAFWNKLHIVPLFDDNRELQYFLGVQHDVTSEVLKSKSDEERILQLERLLKRAQLKNLGDEKKSA